MRNVKYRVLTLALVAGLSPVPGMAGGQPQTSQASADPELQKLADDYTGAWAKGDAAAIAALYTIEGIYVDVQNKLMTGRSEIEARFRHWFGGPFKGSTIAIRGGQTRQLASDVAISEGTWQVSGGASDLSGLPQRAEYPVGTPTAGRYVNTLVRQQGRWMIAGTASVPEPRPAAATH